MSEAHEPDTFEGGCFCGDVRFSIAAAPTNACHCHCKSCQHAAGAGYVTWASFPVRSFSITRGAMAEYASSPGVTRGYCAHCGTSISYANTRRPEEIDIAVACLDNSSTVEVLSHIWLEDKAAWINVDDDLPQFQQRATGDA